MRNKHKFKIESRTLKKLLWCIEILGNGVHNDSNDILYIYNVNYYEKSKISLLFLTKIGMRGK